MTIQDLIEASIELQGHLIVRLYDDPKTQEVFDGDGEELGYASHADEAWFNDCEISFMYPLDREGLSGWCIEVQPSEF